MYRWMQLLVCAWVLGGANAAPVIRGKSSSKVQSKLDRIIKQISGLSNKLDSLGLCKEDPDEELQVMQVLPDTGDAGQILTTPVSKLQAQQPDAVKSDPDPSPVSIPQPQDSNVGVKPLFLPQHLGDSSAEFQEAPAKLTSDGDGKTWNIQSSSSMDDSQAMQQSNSSMDAEPEMAEATAADSEVAQQVDIVVSENSGQDTDNATSHAAALSISNQTDWDTEQTMSDTTDSSLQQTIFVGGDFGQNQASDIQEEKRDFGLNHDENHDLDLNQSNRIRNLLNVEQVKVLLNSNGGDLQMNTKLAHYYCQYICSKKDTMDAAMERCGCSPDNPSSAAETGSLEAESGIDGPEALDTCTLECAYGRKESSDGEEVCQCRPCPELECAVLCGSAGYALGNDGCPVCQCVQSID